MASRSVPITDEEVEEKQRALRAVMVRKSIAYFKKKENRSISDFNLLNRRKNLTKHFGLDGSVEKADLDKMTMASLPFPSSAKECANRLITSKQNSIDQSTQFDGELVLQEELTKKLETCKDFERAIARATKQIDSTNVDYEEELVGCIENACGLEAASSNTPVNVGHEDEIHSLDQSQPNLQSRHDYACPEPHPFVRKPTLKYVDNPKMLSRRVSFQSGRANSTGDLFRNDLSEIDVGYKNKDLSDYLGMKDQVSKSIAVHQLFLEERSLSRAAKTNTSLKRTLSRAKLRIKSISRSPSMKSYGSDPNVSNPPSKSKTPLNSPSKSKAPLKKTVSVRLGGMDHQPVKKDLRMSVLRRNNTERQISCGTTIKE